MNRAFAAGSHIEVWDGRNDAGEKVPPATYEVRLGYNNITYHWDGIIGNTESTWSSFRTWDGVVPSFIRSLAFLKGKAYSANGYNETGFGAAVFDEASPNSEVNPLNRFMFYCWQHLMFAATDGKLLYFGFQTYGGVQPSGQGVIAFYPSGEYYRFPDGDPYSSFPKIRRSFSNIAVAPMIGIPDVRVAGISHYPAKALTGVAVQRSGSLLAAAHGFYKPGGPASVPAPSADEIGLSNKFSGAAIGSFAIPNPQGMAFDLDGSLWVISGYGTQDKLYKISDVGRSNLIVGPIQGLSNPVSVSVSPTTGSIFVADGGDSQQVKELDPRTLRLRSTIGTKGGYFASGACNASVSNTTFWFDPGPDMNEMPVIGTNSPFVSWVSVADNGDVWIGDFSTSRILHFSKSASGWKYVDRIMYLPWALNASVPLDRPSRVFGGPSGFLEFKIDYSVPLVPGDPEAQGGNGSWQLVRNWLPCFVNQDAGSDLSWAMSAYSFPNGADIGVSSSPHSQFKLDTLLMLGKDGVLKVKHIEPLSGWTAFDGSGSYYREFVEPKASSFLVTVKRYGVASYDGDGFPIWFAIGQTIGSYLADHKNGDPIPREQRFTQWPSKNGVIPIFDSEKNFDLLPGFTAFHLGGLPLNGTGLKWKTLPERSIQYTDGEGSFPAADVRRRAGMGVNAWAVDDNIFAFQNGNSSSWSCQFYHFKDDGLFVGQFGFQTSDKYPPGNVGFRITGYPEKGTDQPLAPGECLDSSHVNSVSVKGDYYIYVDDEGYHRGIHRWRISNLRSYGELSTRSHLGSTVALTRDLSVGAR